ncbi:AraC family transcriptional regulator [Gluconacetobacter liquefaciens]|uniref:AraC family transcriptional regulator n=2 Tax=Gluconacetobacter liquefaciens TaxID=89584 RepID=A0A370FZV1_GLULI|nr:AraC family transcriptional regulator [Gluconacetobacter liquefaciens]
MRPMTGPDGETADKTRVDRDPFLIHDGIDHAGLRYFLDIEPLERRSRPANWRVRRHSHAALAQIFVLASGGGLIELDGVSQDFLAPGFIWVPAGAPHSLAYHPRTHGHVITVGLGHLVALADRTRTIAPLQARPRPVATDIAEFDRIVALSQLQPKIEDALSDTVRNATAQIILATVCRLLHAADTPPPTRRDAALVLAFRTLIERDFTAHATLETYLATLNTTERTLRRACIRVSQQTPKDIIQSRIAAEARRLLLFSGLSAAQIAARLGFSDPAYFSRWFRAREGVTIRAFRQERQTG